MGIAVFDGCLGLKVLVVAGSIGGVDVMMVKIVELLEDKVNIGLSRIVIRYKAPTNAALQLIGQGSEAEISCALAVIVEQMAKAESSDDKTFNIYTMGMYVNASMKDGVEKGDTFWEGSMTTYWTCTKGLKRPSMGTSSRPSLQRTRTRSNGSFSRVPCQSWEAF